MLHDGDGNEALLNANVKMLKIKECKGHSSDHIYFLKKESKLFVEITKNTKDFTFFLKSLVVPLPNDHYSNQSVMQKKL